MHAASAAHDRRRVRPASHDTELAGTAVKAVVDALRMPPQSMLQRMRDKAPSETLWIYGAKLIRYNSTTYAKILYTSWHSAPTAGVLYRATRTSDVHARPVHGGSDVPV